jgi:hypothetical protein
MKRKELIKKWKEDELKRIKLSMPITPTELNDLIEYLDMKLNECDRTLNLTQRFLDKHKLDKIATIDWLRNNGGYCDCEVIYNISDLSEELNKKGRPIDILPKKKKKARPRRLITNFGLDISNLPKPWKVVNLYKRSEPINIQFGKKKGCNLFIYEKKLPAGNKQDEKYWIHLWNKETDLDERSEFHVNRNDLVFKSGLKGIIVYQEKWIPVLCWIYSKKSENWFFKVNTELRRFRGDIKEIVKLIDSFKIET